MTWIVLPSMDTLTLLSTAIDSPAAGPADAILWVVQWLLAATMVAGNTLAAVLILTGRLDASRIRAIAALSGPMLAFLGLAHVAGAIGLVLPQLLGFLSWLTPVAALALAVQAFMASGFHLRAHEEALEPALWGALYCVVAVGRLDLLGVATPLPDATIVIAIIVLSIALAVNLVILLRGPRNPFRELSEPVRAQDQGAIAGSARPQ